MILDVHDRAVLRLLMSEKLVAAVDAARILGVQRWTLLNRAGRKKGLRTISVPTRVEADRWVTEMSVRIESRDKFEQWLRERRPEVIEFYHALEVDAELQGQTLFLGTTVMARERSKLPTMHKARRR